MYTHKSLSLDIHRYTHTQQELIRMYTHTAQRQGNRGLEVGSMIIGMGVFFLCVASMFFLGGRLRDYGHVCVCGVCVRCLYFSLSALSLSVSLSHSVCFSALVSISPLCACLSLSLPPWACLLYSLSLTHLLTSSLVLTHPLSFSVMCVCMYVCVYAHTHTHKHTHTHACIF
jgi:hypothetical protein